RQGAGEESVDIAGVVGAQEIGAGGLLGELELPGRDDPLMQQRLAQQPVFLAGEAMAGRQRNSEDVRVVEVHSLNLVQNATGNALCCRGFPIRFPAISHTYPHERFGSSAPFVAGALQAAWICRNSLSNPPFERGKMQISTGERIDCGAQMPAP